MRCWDHPCCLSSKALRRLPSRRSVASFESELSMSRDPTKERLAISAEISRAEETEAAVWDFVSGILKDPERLRRGIDEMLDRERALTSRSPGDDEEGWLKKLSELVAQEERLLDLYLEGKLEIGRYESRVSQIKQSRRTIEDELERIRNHSAHIERLEHDRNALVSHYSRIAADHLDELEPQERNRVYKMLGLTVLAHRDGSLEAKWALGVDPCRDNELLPPGSYRTPGR